MSIWFGIRIWTKKPNITSAVRSIRCDRRILNNELKKEKLPVASEQIYFSLMALHSIHLSFRQWMKREKKPYTHCANMLTWIYCICTLWRPPPPSPHLLLAVSWGWFLAWIKNRIAVAKTQTKVCVCKWTFTVLYWVGWLRFSRERKKKTILHFNNWWNVTAMIPQL